MGAVARFGREEKEACFLQRYIMLLKIDRPNLPYIVSEMQQPRGPYIKQQPWSKMSPLKALQVYVL